MMGAAVLRILYSFTFGNFVKFCVYCSAALRVDLDSRGMMCC